jgi:Glycogen recognition site of AMP-activated protein kinase
MTDSDQNPYVEWIAREARRPVVVDAGARDRIMAAVRAEPIPHRTIVRRAGNALRRFAEPRALTVSPAWSTLLAAGLVGIGVFAGKVATNRDGRPTAGQPRVAAVSQLPVSDTFVKFSFVAPAAKQVFLVGDFNDWDVSKTPMAESGGVWSVVVPMRSGRHQYSYVVDGKSWSNDPNAPSAPDDGFGHTNSVKIVGRGSTS